MTPALSARARRLSFGQAVIRIVGMLLGRADTWRCRSRPLIPGILISVTRQAVRLRSEDRKNSSPDENASAASPVDRTRVLVLRRTDSSSSTIAIRPCFFGIASLQWADIRPDGLWAPSDWA